MDTLISSKIAVNFSLSPAINFAMQQNHVPVGRELTLDNIGESDLKDIKIQITSEPDFAAPWIQYLDILKSGESRTYGVVSISISSRYLAELTERLTGRFTLTVTSENEVVYHEDYNVDLLAYDQWNGIGLLPEMLAAFITPNHPQISKIIRNASVILEKWTGNPAFDEYQSRNPDRVRKQMAAIYEAISELQLVYCSAASFEESGQRIRLSDFIFSQGLANCLDLSLLYAACLEAVGINPLVIIIKGHAFAGAWLINESFADPVNDDSSLISKRMVEGINEIAIVESTCMNSGNHVSFDHAVRSAESKMIETEKFLLFMDVKRARFGGIRPLPLRIQSGSGWEIVEEVTKSLVNDLPEEIFIGQKLVENDKTNFSKQRLWERKLLDLTLRNNLLNIRITKSFIQFITVGLGKLEDTLADGKELQVLPKPTDWDNSLRDVGIYQSLHSSDPIADLVKQELSQHRLRSYLTESELNYSLTSLYRSSRLSIEENGANTLFIGLGLLKWFETESSERPRFAPILLIPVEIIRKSAQKGYMIRSREEETIVNITLLEMIRQDFGVSINGLETLPKDESGVDVKTVFNIFRQAIMSKSRWDVEEQAVLGTFSFSKFILWNDIHNNSDKLSKNKVVASLISGKLEFPVDDEIRLISDSDLHPSTLALPISADSSQFQAILSSGEGKNFVLHGPPGTGKSQTITNIIANALYAGKKVLFVAAKKAALEVVESRLESIGIGDFCLELHSNKSKKSDVLEQLRKATQVVKKNSPESFQSTADRLHSTRAELNTYVESLHYKYPFGYSLFELFSNYLQLAEFPDKVCFPASQIESLTSQKVSEWTDLVEELQAIAFIVKEPEKHPLKAMQLTDYTSQLKGEGKQLIEKFRETLITLDSATSKVSALLSLDSPIKNQEQLATLVEVLGLLQSLPDSPPSLFAIDSLEQTLAQIIGIATHGVQRDKLRIALLDRFTSEILSFPADRTLIDWNIASEKWFIPKWLKQHSIAKSLKKMSTIGKVHKEDISGILENIKAYQAEREIIDRATYLPGLLGFLWQNGDCDWNVLSQLSDTTIKINRLASSLTGLTPLKDWRHKFALLIAEGSRSYITSHQKEFTHFTGTFEAAKSSINGLTTSLGIDFSKLSLDSENWIQSTIRQCDEWLLNIDSLKDWFNYTAIRNVAINVQLNPLIVAYENSDFTPDNLVNVFKKGLYKSAAEFIIDRDKYLATFNGQLFESKIKRFQELSKRFEELTKEELYAKLAAKIPSFTQEASQSSEIGMLQRTIRNNGRAMPIRKLFDAIPNLLPRLTPCMLMSPISVAQYFDANAAKFDLVVFDEASQMPTCEAVGAIARGTSVIVVGDPKQMPPTNFFTTNNVDEENIEKEDLESILDDCLALSMPSHHLLWHYRSKHESLIAFSNARYYENKLFTFPSTDDLSSKVTFVKVQGYYDKGRTRQNHAEGKAIVDEIVRRLSDPTLSKKSLGVVTFSSVQQILIDDMINEVFALRPDLERIALECPEPLFIKNLENVQGDERDVILFSIGYGPGEDGKVTLNFGPINRDGGWRRLNVAVSRARYEMKVFSTLTSDQIDLNRTGSEGVAGLKAFLAYAEKGKQALPVRALKSDKTSSGFEYFLAAEIRKHGYEVHTHIGCSEYKIDICVVNPRNPSRYLLAILGDGKTYHAAKTSSDREIVQVEVLKMLGWNIFKVWSTAWWENPDKVLNDILSAIHKAEEGISIESKSVTFEDPIDVQLAVDENLRNNDGAFLHEPRPQNRSLQREYEVAVVEVVLCSSSEDFFMWRHREKIKSQILQVLEIESPITKSLLSKRVLSGWGITRLGSRIYTHFEILFSELRMKQTIDGDKITYWKPDHQPEEYSVFRIATFEPHRRDADDLPVEEIANGIKEILANQISLSHSDLIKEASRLFGYFRIGTNVESAMTKGIQRTLNKGFVKAENGRIIYMYP